MKAKNSSRREETRAPGSSVARRFARQLSAACLLLLPAAGAAAQSNDDATRGLWDTAFLQQRPPGRAATARRHTYRPAAANKTARVEAIAAKAVVGITVWRLRPSANGDEVRQLIHGQQGEWTPERVSAEEPLREGERVQITVEAPRSGYLYVFDREVYANKSLGDPYLIFPTTAIRGGDNLVKAGRVIEIPSSEDKPPFYTIQKSRPDYEGELLTVLITEAPLAELSLGPGALRLPKEQVSSYEKRWGAAVDNIELVDGPGTPMTAAEKKAAEGKRLLTRSDPMPQSIYRVRSKPGEPLLLSVFLRIKPQS
jgi:Domain of unknown function (DUF4384)